MTTGISGQPTTNYENIKATKLLDILTVIDHMNIILNHKITSVSTEMCTYVTSYSMALSSSI